MNLLNRRNLITGLGAGGLGLIANSISAQTNLESADNDASKKIYRLGVISASIRGKPQITNGHTWHFTHCFHPQVNLDAIKKYLDPGSSREFEVHFRNSTMNLDQIPFNDTQIAYYYTTSPEEAAKFCEAFPGVQPAESIEQMIGDVDAIWLGDASGYGDDHFDLVAPGLEKGLPTFCDKPIGGTVSETRKILDFARSHETPIMSSSLFRHQWGMETALRMRDSGDFGPLQYVIASLMGGYNPDSWFVYGQHPLWSVMTLCGPGVQAVSAYARENTCHVLITYNDRMPAEVWYGRPDVQYSDTQVTFQKKTYNFSSDIEDDWWFGHHYEIFRMANTFRDMIRTRVEPVPHQEILEVTAMLYAAAKSMAEKGRLVDLAEVMEK
ncbi:MAG: Gfo/Idh/MocA family oxidoreductase [Planctomycetota bacterium]|nr:Gfo/Idh/MocA family oxidoreductase [Planctomycetota bacterium]MDA1213110.1 Gfo/Idh/MocA family oxidoreductase [Planctomycetota bacterium]